MRKTGNLMDKTFPYRCRLIVTDMIKVQQLKSDFPFLFDEQQVGGISVSNSSFAVLTREEKFISRWLH